MSLTSDLEAHGDEAAADASLEGATKVTGRSPMQLAMARFRSDKLSMISFVGSTIIVLCAIAAPILVAVGVLNPNEFHQDLLSDRRCQPGGQLRRRELGPPARRRAVHRS